MGAAENRYRRAMIATNTGGKCRFCKHSVADLHVGSYCAGCNQVGDVCGVVDFLANRQRERELLRITR